jgi:CheY-like chemotaxis protein
MSRVLIVEDERSISDMLELVCNMAGVETRTAANGRSALAVLESFAPDLILTDFMMPVMDGAEFLQVLRRDPGTARTPVIIMTAAPEVVARRCSGETIVPKPIDLDEMIRTLRQLGPGTTNWPS